MSGIAGLIHWHGSPVDRDHIDRMLSPVRHRGPDGISIEVVGAVGLGHANLAMTEKEKQYTQPVWLPGREAVIVADARLYNSAALFRTLGGNISRHDGFPSDAALILAAYEKWGTGLLNHIDGDFAFAIWDKRSRQLFASKDPFGAKPFFYHANGRRFTFGSEIKQLLSLPEIEVAPDHMIVGEYLFRQFQDVRHTFFKGIRRLPPAHYLIATEGGIRLERYWSPDPTHEVRYENTQDYYDRFRELMSRSVLKRLGTDYPVTADLSGGMDSPSIVVSAAEIYRRYPRKRPPLNTVSSVFGNLPCDESDYINAVVRTTPFEHQDFNPLNEHLAEGLVDDIWQIDSPFADIQRGSFQLISQAMRFVGSRIRLTGLGGDEVTHEEYYLRDLAARGRFFRLGREAYIGSKTSWNSFWFLFNDALKTLAPEPAKQSIRKILGRGRWTPPAWATAEFAERFLSYPEPPPPPRMGFPSMIQETMLQYVNYPTICWVLEALEATTSYSGYEPRHPFFDRELVEFVLAIPFEHRLTDGKWKCLIHRGMGSLLPDSILSRTRKTMFDSYHRHMWNNGRAEISEMLFDSQEWASGYYIDRGTALSMFRADADKTGANRETLWRLTTTELWLRGFSRYNTVNITSDPPARRNA